MKIAFVHNKYFPYTRERPFKHSAGGAALTNVMIIQEGENRGHKIDIIYAYTNNKSIKIQDYNKVDMKQYDLVILSHIPKFQPQWIEHIAETCKFIRWDHAYDFCGQGVVNMHPSQCFSLQKCKYCKISLNQKLHLNACLSVFQSPLHQKWHESCLGIKIKTAWILPCPIDVELFKIKKRDPAANSFLIVGSIMKHKGIEAVLKYIDEHKLGNYMFIGSCKNKEYLLSITNRNNCKFRGHVNNWELPAIYEKHEHFIHFPLWPEPSGRSTMEAILMGCVVITNENSGVMSYDFIRKKPEEIREIIKNAPKNFWLKVEECVK